MIWAFIREKLRGQSSVNFPVVQHPTLGSSLREMIKEELASVTCSSPLKPNVRTGPAHADVVAMPHILSVPSVPDASRAHLSLLRTNRSLTMDPTTQRGLAQRCTTAASGAIFPSFAGGASKMNAKHFPLHHRVMSIPHTTTDCSRSPILDAAHHLLLSLLTSVPPPGLTAANHLHLTFDSRKWLRKAVFSNL